MSQVANAKLPRLKSLDQFRGYTIAGMFLVNFMGGFYAAPYLFGHHLVFCSYADTIMPQFFFAVGFSMRLSWKRRLARDGLWKTYLHSLRRSLALALIAIIWYGGRPYLPEGTTFEWASFSQIGVWGAVWKQLKVDWFQTLMHIAVTSIWILPVIRASARWRIAYLLLSVVLHAWLNHWFYFAWHNAQPFKGIDGGPLGFLTWSIPTLIGTLAYDWVESYQRGVCTKSQVCARLVFHAGLLCLLGWILSFGTRWYDTQPGQTIDESSALPILAEDPVVPRPERWSRWSKSLAEGNWQRVLPEPPFVPPPHAREPRENDRFGRTVDRSSLYRPWNYWMMSQQVGSPSYLVFSAGLCLAIYALFLVLAEFRGVEFSVLRTLGVNSLIGYLLHSVVADFVQGFMPRDVPVFVMWSGFAIFFIICWWMLRALEKKGIYLKL